MPNCDISKEEIIKCFHCGNETPMLKVGEYFWGSCEMRFSDFEFFHKYIHIFYQTPDEQITVHLKELFYLCGKVRFQYLL